MCLEYPVLFGTAGTRVWSHLAYLFLEWEMFRTKDVEKIKTHFVFNKAFRKSCRLWDNLEKCGRVRQTTD
jgi:hypothetical protein